MVGFCLTSVDFTKRVWLRAKAYDKKGIDMEHEVEVFDAVKTFADVGTDRDERAAASLIVVVCTFIERAEFEHGLSKLMAGKQFACVEEHIVVRLVEFNFVDRSSLMTAREERIISLKILPFPK